MGIEDIVGMAKDAMVSSKIEEITDTALDKAEEFANKVTDDKFEEPIHQVREAIDGAIGGK